MYLDNIVEIKDSKEILVGNFFDRYGIQSHCIGFFVGQDFEGNYWFWNETNGDSSILCEGVDKDQWMNPTEYEIDFTAEDIKQGIASHGHSEFHQWAINYLS